MDLGVVFQWFITVRSYSYLVYSWRQLAHVKQTQMCHTVKSLQNVFPDTLDQVVPPRDIKVKSFFKWMRLAEPTNQYIQHVMLERK